jgi:hypothetical protein
MRTRAIARPRWLTKLPSNCLYGFLLILVFLISEPFLGKIETYEVKEARSILLLVDTSASMIQTRLLAMVVEDVLIDFIYRRPKEERMALVRFDSDASGGIFTQNHQGVLLEITRPSVIQDVDLDFLERLGKEKGTQIGLGLFKALTSFLEDEVETRIALKHLDIEEQDKIYKALQSELQQFLRFWRQKTEEPYPLKIPLVSNLEEMGLGKVLIVITDGQLLDPTSTAERVDYLKLLDYYERLGFRHLYFVSLKTHPAELNPHLNRNPTWKAYTWDTSAVGLKDMFAEIERDVNGIEQGKSIVSTQIKEKYIFYLFLPSILLLLMAVGLQFHKRIRHFP